MQKTRTHYQDQMVLTSHDFELKKPAEETSKGRKRAASGSAGSSERGISNLLLIVNNWGFVREVQHKAEVRLCTPSDFQVQIKLSSTAFRTALNPDCEFPFDKQSANFPYDSFLQLHQSQSLKKFIREVREQYYDIEGPFPDEEEEEAGGFYNESSDDDAPLKIATSQQLQQPEEEEEEEDERLFKKPARVIRGKKCPPGPIY